MTDEGTRVEASYRKRVMRPLVWIRRDLRLTDNTALIRACEAATDGCVAVFAITPQQWQEHDEAPAKVEFWLENLRALHEALAAKNIPLKIVTTDEYDGLPNVLLDAARSVGADSLWMNREHEVNERRRDAAVTEAFEADDHEVHAFDDHTVLPPLDVRTKQGGPYSVFSPYKRAWIEVAKQSAIDPLGTPATQQEIDVTADAVPGSIKGFDFGTARLDLWPAGEDAAQGKLGAFIGQRIASYEDRRDLPGTNGTSTISPYLAAGVISPRQALHAALGANRNRFANGSKGADTWISELIWREFYQQVLRAFPRVSMHRAFRPDLDERVVWRDDPEGLEAWKEGMTGVPIVDGAMRQLKQTGWMHNRLRMVVAMFLSKNLLIDWREGERHFMRHLIDGDLGANNGGWQWSASVGTDAAPYFRIFNPISQSERFDPDGKFLHRFVPQLEGVTGKDLHDPRRLGDIDRRGRGYPEMIVDPKSSRQRAIDAFKEASN